MTETFQTLSLGAVVLFGFLVAAAFTKNKLYSSLLFAAGAISFLLFFLDACNHTAQGFSNIH